VDVKHEGRGKGYEKNYSYGSYHETGIIEVEKFVRKINLKYSPE
jgi:hypothetical protein